MVTTLGSIRDAVRERIGGTTQGEDRVVLAGPKGRFDITISPSNEGYETTLASEVEVVEPDVHGTPYRSQALTSRARATSRPAVVFTVESGTDQLGKQIGLNREVQLGDEAFDEFVYVKTDAPEEQVREVFGAEPLRDEIFALLKSHQGKLVVNDGSPSLMFTFTTSRDTELPALVESAYQALVTIRSQLPLFEGRAKASARARDWLLPLVGVATVLAGVISLVMSLDRWPAVDDAPYVYGVFLGLGGWAVHAILAALLSRGSAVGLRTFGLTVGPALIGYALFGVAALLYANGALDPHPVERHRVKVTQKTREGSDEPDFYVRVSDWRPRHTMSVKLEVSKGFWDSVAIDEEVEVTAGRGRYGWAWWTEISK